jgi:hypothetical protein
MHDCLEQIDYESLAKLLEPREAENDDRSAEAMIHAETDKFHAVSLEHLDRD